MKKNRTCFIIILIHLLCLNYLTQATTVQAASHNKSHMVHISLESLNSNSPVQLSGLHSSSSMDFYLPKPYQAANNSFFEFALSASSMLDQSRSSLTIEINNRNIYTVRISEAASQQIRSVRIPNHLLMPGKNTIRLTGMLYLPGDPSNDCQNWNDSARWINFFSESRLSIELVPTANTYQLSDIYDIFSYTAQNEGGPFSPDSTVVVLPDQPQADDLSGLTSLAYAFGSHSTSMPAWKPKVIYASQMTPDLKTENHLIFINVPDATLPETNTADKDLLLVRNSPWNTQKAVMVVTDQSRTDGYSPADILSNSNAALFLKGNQLMIDSPMTVNLPPDMAPDLSFELMGYSDRSVTGIGENSLTYRVYVPYNQQITYADLSLLLHYSPDLNMNKSRIHVYLNGYAIAGIVPNEGETKNQAIPVPVSAERFRAGTNYIRIVFNLQPETTHCELAQPDTWATVSNQSFIRLNSQRLNKRETLTDFPMPFSDNPSGLMIVPNVPETNLLENAATLSFLLGQSAMIQNKPVHMQQVSEFLQNPEKEKYILAIGLPKDNEIIRKINSRLPQPFTERGDGMASGYGVYASADEQPASLGVIEIGSSPWKSDGVIMIISGTSAEGLQWSWNLINSKEEWKNFKGNLMLLGSYQYITSDNRTDPGRTYMWDMEQADKIPVIGTYLQAINPQNFVPAVVSILSAFLLMITLIMILQFSKWKK